MMAIILFAAELFSKNDKDATLTEPDLNDSSFWEDSLSDDASSSPLNEQLKVTPAVPATKKVAKKVFVTSIKDVLDIVSVDDELSIDSKESGLNSFMLPLNSSMEGAELVSFSLNSF